MESKHIAQSGPFYDEFEILEALKGTESAEQIFRVDLETKHYEDFSEEIAETYIRDNSICLDGAVEHPFIENSNAYAELLKEQKAQKSNDIIYGRYEQQHRLCAYDLV
ncbi:hypothetical protein X471_00008 [Bartonella bacilliformis str. Heidi Mejia]|uniref:hypothetical protein n=1 Tax=Bartonella bacilliformis TaxID=774 RepID=UPI00045107ED|nr:hypothetical protein [Bartonella bacilliformis]EYS92520.1 hypothetical protein X471_00008 [Bartonella bacilliformis str. Heidi Mejia]KEG18281.1 hypothetical protein H707_00938 [Bartonella bacilliformis Hosp800-02]KEG24647.1 hypothetical protein H706_00948 [Bartonella bacilliformis CAR600-02]